jgi:hypothetical protein
VHGVRAPPPLQLLHWLRLRFRRAPPTSLRSLGGRRISLQARVGLGFTSVTPASADVGSVDRGGRGTLCVRVQCPTAVRSGVACTPFAHARAPPTPRRTVAISLSRIHGSFYVVTKAAQVLPVRIGGAARVCPVLLGPLIHTSPSLWLPPLFPFPGTLCPCAPCVPLCPCAPCVPLCPCAPVPLCPMCALCPCAPVPRLPPDCHDLPARERDAPCCRVSFPGVLHPFP